MNSVLEAIANFQENGNPFPKIWGIDQRGTPFEKVTINNKKFLEVLHTDQFIRSNQPDTKKHEH